MTTHRDEARPLPPTMNAIHFDAPGTADVLKLQNMPLPELAEGMVLIAVAYAGVNRPDVIQRTGLYPPPKGASPLLGLEISGTIVALGEGVAETWMGRRVCALTPGGGYAPYCRVLAEHCLPVDDAMPLAEAAAIPETLFTVWHNVFQRGLARDSERLLVHGGTSGIGTMAIMLGKAFGLEVFVTCGSDAKCAAALGLGADHAINYREADFVEAIRTLTDGEGVHLVLDMVSGEYVARNLKCLRDDGRHVTIAVSGGTKAELNMAAILRHRLTLTGSTLRPRSDAFKALLCTEIEAEAWPLFTTGELRPVMDRVFPLAEAAVAHARMEEGAHIGKIVLQVCGEVA